MELKDQVCSLYLAKRLKELGVKQESLFYWYKDSIDVGEFNWELGVLDDSIHGKRLCGFGYGLDCVHGKMPFVSEEYVSAFTVAELLHFIGKPLPVPAEGAADYLAEELIRMYENGGNN